MRLSVYSVEKLHFLANSENICPHSSNEDFFARGSTKMGFRPCCGFLELFAATLTKFQQGCALGGNSQYPNLGVFQQNKPEADGRELLGNRLCEDWRLMNYPASLNRLDGKLNLISEQNPIYFSYMCRSVDHRNYQVS
jgi:hypothetical protein